MPLDINTLWCICQELKCNYVEHFQNLLWCGFYLQHVWLVGLFVVLTLWISSWLTGLLDWYFQKFGASFAKGCIECLKTWIKLLCIEHDFAFLPHGFMWTLNILTQDSCAVHYAYIICHHCYKSLLNKFFKSFIHPTNAQLNFFKMLKFTLRFIINAPTCFSLTKPSSGSLQSELH
jgi:hypothetical protein